MRSRSALLTSALVLSSLLPACDCTSPSRASDGGDAGATDASTRDGGAGGDGGQACTPSGTEVCDGVDNDCNGKVDEGYTLLCRPCADAGCVEAKLSGGAFLAGASRNLTIGDDLGLALPPLPRAQPYIYISNSGEDTVSKIRTTDAVEVGRILVGTNPSRTAVDGRGDAWIAMRGNVSDDGSGPLENVIKISGDCVPTVAPPTPTRECILLDRPKVGNLLRGIAVDARNDIWVGAYATLEVILIDGETGEELQRVGLPGRPYGIAMDNDGYLWVSAHSAAGASGRVYRVDPAQGQVDLTLGDAELQANSTYGLAADGEGGVWFANFRDSVFRVDTSDGGVGPTYTVGTITRGLAADDQGFLWAADSAQNALLKIDRRTGATLTFPVGSGPVGVAVDHEGNVWSVNQGSGDATKLSPDGGVLATVKVGSDPYTYSDMTGSAWRLFRTMKGFFVGRYETGLAGARWRRVTWAGVVPSTSTFTVRVRASDGDLSRAPWREVTFTGQSAALDLVGDSLELEVRLTTADRQALPHVEQFTFEIERQP
ncbi:MAG: MopE-related protein [Myxococcales bacterium]|nr:MopE-related protein [Myxococcales bacterium]